LQLISDSIGYCCYRHNQALEQRSVDMQEERVRLEQETHTLTERMEVLMHDKFEHTSSSFDAETPIEKVLNMLHAFITQVHFHSIIPALSTWVSPEQLSV